MAEGLLDESQENRDNDRCLKRLSKSDEEN